jgi:C-terminal processing protease CtpA/Prc
MPGPEYFARCNNSNLGMKLRKLPGGKSYIVSAIYSSSPIPGAGINLGDMVLFINGVPTEEISTREMDSIENKPIGTNLSFQLQRGQILFTREITVQNIW